MSSCLSDDVACILFEYLPPLDALHLGECSHQLLRLLSLRDRAIFEPLLRSLYQDKIYNVPEGSLMQRIKALSISRLKRHLLDVPTSKCIEKIDFQRKLFGKLLFHYPFGRIPRQKWPYHMSDWKASYFHAKRDLRRQTIMLSELVNIKWEFKFRHYPGAEAWTLRFFEDFTVLSSLHGETMSWRQVDSGAIQVELYPILRSSRLQNGQWILENNNVVITQVGLYVSSVPLIDIFL